MQFTTIDVPFQAVPPVPVPRVDDTICLVGAKDACHASYEELAAVPVPPSTYRESTGNASYQTVPYSEFATGVRTIFAHILDVEPLSECYALAANGNQMHGRITFPYAESDSHDLQVCLRSSYDKSIALQVAGGLSTFICANGQLSAESMIALKHTAEVGSRLPMMIADMARSARDTARVLAERIARWASTEVGDDLFFAYVGILRGRGIINPSIANSAIRYWQACRSGRLHTEHSDPTLANAYQAVSGGLHKVAPARAFHAYAGADAITEGVAQSGGSLVGIPAFDLEIAEF